MATQATLKPGPDLQPRALRAALGVSRERMARLLDVSAKSVERWERDGELPLYLASDRAVVVAEFARHLGSDIVPGIERRANVRQIYRFSMRVEHALDIRDPRALDALSLGGAPHSFLDPQIGRATAHY